jgi:MerC mercury resistance protein
MTTMTRLYRPIGLDRLAMYVSGLCIVHCVASAVFFAMLSTVGGLLGNPIFHEVGLGIAIVLGAIGLGRGAMQHGYLLPLATGSLGLGIMAGAMTLPHHTAFLEGGEALWTIIGVGILAFGHDLNRRAEN